VFRYERSGTLHGLFRVRGFTQDDAHVFCLPEQIATEIRAVLDLVQVRLCCLVWFVVLLQCSSIAEPAGQADAAGISSQWYL